MAVKPEDVVLNVDFNNKNFEINKIIANEEELNMTPYYAHVDNNILNIYTEEPNPNTLKTTLYELVTDKITEYNLVNGQAPADNYAVFYLVNRNAEVDLFEDFKVSDFNYVFPCLGKTEIENASKKIKEKKDAAAAEELRKQEAIAAAALAEDKRKQDEADAEKARLEAERLETERLEAERLELERVAAAASTASTAAAASTASTAAAASTTSTAATTSKPERRGFPNFGSSCWALSIIHLFYDTPDFREHILKYKIHKKSEIFNMEIPHYIGVKSGEMSTQYHIDKLKSDNNDMFTKMDSLFNTTSGTYKNIPNIQYVWGFHIFRDEVLEIIDNTSITNIKSAIGTLYATLLVKRNNEETQFKDEIEEIKKIKDNVTQMNEIFIYAFQILFKYTSGEYIEPDTLIKSLFVIPLIIFGEFGERDNTEFITKLAQLCEISIDSPTYTSKSKIDQTFYVKDPSNLNRYLGDLIGIKKYFRITSKDNMYYYDGTKCSDIILSSRESFMYGISIGIASEYIENNSVETYLTKSNPVPSGSFFLPDKENFFKNNQTLIEDDYNEIEKKCNSQINILNDKKWEILQTKFKIPVNVKKLDAEIHENTLKINRIMTDFQKFQEWLKTNSITVVIPTVSVNSKVDFTLNNTKMSGVVTKIEQDTYTIKYNTFAGDIEIKINKKNLIQPTITDLWNNANADYKHHEKNASTNQCQKSNAQNFVTGKYLCVSLMRKTIDIETNRMGELIETKINLNDTIMVDSKQYKLIGATIYQGGHYYYDNIRDSLKINDDAVTVLDNNEKKYIEKHWSIALYEQNVDTNASTRAHAGGSRKTFRVSRRKQVRPL
jgi:hypothetical protein